MADDRTMSAMAVLALVLTFAWVGLVAAAGGYLQARRIGRVVAPVPDRRWSPQWWSRRISTLGFALAVAAPLADLAGLPPLTFLDEPVLGVLGIVFVIVGVVLAVTAQVAMGASWRADVDAGTVTDLVTTGPFRFVRNPIFTGSATTALGLALMVPNVLAAAMLVAVVTSLQIQVRLVEEPYLLRVHGEAYRRYAARTGRFLPWVGRLPD